MGVWEVILNRIRFCWMGFKLPVNRTRNIRRRRQRSKVGMTIEVRYQNHYTAMTNISNLIWALNFRVHWRLLVDLKSLQVRRRNFILRNCVKHYWTICLQINPLHIQKYRKRIMIVNHQTTPLCQRKANILSIFPKTS